MMTENERLLLERIQGIVTGCCQAERYIIADDFRQIKDSELLAQSIDSMHKSWRVVYDHCWGKSLKTEVIEFAAKRAQKATDCFDFLGIDSKKDLEIILSRALDFPQDCISYLVIAKNHPDINKSTKAWMNALESIASVFEAARVIEGTDSELIANTAIKKGIPLSKNFSDIVDIRTAIAEADFGGSLQNRETKNNLFLQVILEATNTNIPFLFKKTLATHALQIYVRNEEYGPRETVESLMEAVINFEKYRSRISLRPEDDRVRKTFESELHHQGQNN